MRCAAALAKTPARRLNRSIGPSAMRASRQTLPALALAVGLARILVLGSGRSAAPERGVLHSSDRAVRSSADGSMHASLLGCSPGFAGDHHRAVSDGGQSSTGRSTYEEAGRGECPPCHRAEVEGVAEVRPHRSTHSLSQRQHGGGLSRPRQATPGQSLLALCLRCPATRPSRPARAVAELPRAVEGSLPTSFPRLLPSLIVHV